LTSSKRQGTWRIWSGTGKKVAEPTFEEIVDTGTPNTEPWTGRGGGHGGIRQQKKGVKKTGKQERKAKGVLKVGRGRTKKKGHWRGFRKKRVSLCENFSKVGCRGGGHGEVMTKNGKKVNLASGEKNKARQGRIQRIPQG